jgi:alanyl-tRNA synthetase
MKPFSTDELRECYLDFFTSKGHRRCESDVLVPKWDKSVLFTPAGMNPFKDHFLGKIELEFTRATSCQKCLRTGDIDNVGRTAYHHTFFEMLGNFSFGDYFKREAIHWAWEFLTDKKWLAIDRNRLTVTVYLDDDEAAEIWHKEVGLTLDRIVRMDENDNFWPAGAPTNGPDGVCGPCSEIFYHPPGGKKEVEIWNLVFTQFNRDGNPPNNLFPLPNKNIDTGMGLERTAAQLQGVDTNYHIDILKPIVEAAADVCEVAYIADSDNGRRLRRITDHIRACSFAIHENVYPGAAKEEYVVRRLLRRAVLDGHQMGLREPFLYKLVGSVAAMMKKPYPDLSETVDRVSQIVRHEEATFLGSLDGALARIEKIFIKASKASTRQVHGDDVADLYQTFGVPPELLETLARDQGFAVDWDGYKQAMEEHGRVSGKIADSVMGNFGPIDDIKRDVKSVDFIGYETTDCTSEICGLVANNELVQKLQQPSTKSNDLLVLRKTPFYAESGGQVGDTGEIVTETGVFVVSDTQKDGDVILHYGSLKSGTVAVGQTAKATVDQVRREAIRRAHSATHVLHHALQLTLGNHAQQRGSKVSADWLRFDFSNMQAVTADELHHIEKICNQRISSPHPVVAQVLPLNEARQKGAMMLFGEKYPDPVRMISMGDFSRELCGGTHVANTTEIGVLEIQTEEGVSSGTRRIEALTGERAKEFSNQVRHEIAAICKSLQTTPERFPHAVMELTKRVKDLKKQLSSGKAPGKEGSAESEHTPIETDYFSQRAALRESARLLNVPMTSVNDRVASLRAEIAALETQVSNMDNSGSLSAAELAKSVQTLSGVPTIVQEVVVSNPALLRQLVDDIRGQLNSVAVFLAAATGPDKVVLVAGVTPDLIAKGIRAGDWIKEVAPHVGGGGGGRPDFAQAGGKQPENIRPALQVASEFVRTALLV